MDFKDYKSLGNNNLSKFENAIIMPREAKKARKTTR
jgi:hypothetical protein